MMPVPQSQSYNMNLTATSLPNGVETVAGTSKAVNSPYPGAQFLITFTGLVTVGAGAGGLFLAIRRQSLTGAQVLAPVAQTVVASTNAAFVFSAVDPTVGDLANAQWVFTINVSGGAAAGTMVWITSTVVAAQ